MGRGEVSAARTALAPTVQGLTLVKMAPRRDRIRKMQPHGQLLRRAPIFRRRRSLLPDRPRSLEVCQKGVAVGAVSDRASTSVRQEATAILTEIEAFAG